MTAQANGSIIHHDEGESAVGEAVVAIVTPFTFDGKVDEQALEAYLQVRFTRCRAFHSLILSLSVFSMGRSTCTKTASRTSLSTGTQWHGFPALCAALINQRCATYLAGL